MWPSPSVRQRAGELSAAAERFVAERWGARAERYRGGPDGLRALCKQLERFAYALDVDDEGERRFVEGAGALLGVLLIEHVPGATHRSSAGQHRVQLGAHGFFDPFAAIDRALDAPDIRHALAAEVQRAEAEAAAEGPISRVVGALLGLLACERPDLSLAAQFDCALTLRWQDTDETIDLDVKRAVEATSDQQQAAVENVVRRLLSMLPSPMGGAPRDPALRADLRGRLVPRLARSADLHALSARGQGVLFARPLLAELSVALVLEHEGRARYLRDDELPGLELDREQAYTLALDNLRARSARARLVRDADSETPLWVARTGDGRDSARALLPELFGELRERLGQRVALALPHRDTFFACSMADGAALQALAARAAHDAARAPHALSPALFELSSAGLRPLLLGAD